MGVAMKIGEKAREKDISLKYPLYNALQRSKTR